MNNCRDSVPNSTKCILAKIVVLQSKTLRTLSHKTNTNADCREIVCTFFRRMSIVFLFLIEDLVTKMFEKMNLVTFVNGVCRLHCLAFRTNLALAVDHSCSVVSR